MVLQCMYGGALRENLGIHVLEGGEHVPDVFTTFLNFFGAVMYIFSEIFLKRPYFLIRLNGPFKKKELIS